MLFVSQKKIQSLREVVHTVNKQPEMHLRFPGDGLEGQRAKCGGRFDHKLQKCAAMNAGPAVHGDSAPALMNRFS